MCALLAAAAVGSPQLQLTLAPLMPLPFAFVALRYGRLPAITAAIGLFAGGFIATAPTVGVPIALGFGLALAWLAGVTALVVWAAGMTHPLQRLPLTALTCSYLLLMLLLVGIAVVANGVDSVRSDLTAQVGHTLEDGRRDCGVLGSLNGDQQRECERFYDMGIGNLDTIRANVFAIFLPMLALAALLWAAITLFLARLLGSRAGLPIHRPGPFPGFTVHWSIAYVIAVGLMALMANTALGPNEPLLAIGATSLVLGVTLLWLQGMAVMAFLFRAWRVRPVLQVVFWVSSVVFYLVSPVLFVLLGLNEMVFHFRRRVGSTIGPGE